MGDPWPSPLAERACAAGVLVLHALLVVWALATQSVTYDENFHVPAGVVVVARGDAGVSPANPPLVKALFGMAALAAGAAVPADSLIAHHDQAAVGEAFMRLNASRYQRIYTAARLVTLALSLVLGLVVWRAARGRFGPRGGLFALALWAFTPDAIAHAGVATMDVATALGWIACSLAMARWCRDGRWSSWGLLAATAVAFVLTRFTAVLLLPLAVLFLLQAAASRRPLPWVRMLAGVLALVALAWSAVVLAYGGHLSSPPLAELGLRSAQLGALAHAHPGWRLPLPGALVRGLDKQAFDAEPGHLSTYVLGQITGRSVWWYFPFAVLCKWPLALLVAAALRVMQLALRPSTRERASWTLLPAAAFLVPVMFSGNLDAGVRYVLPLLPLVAVECGSLAAPATGEGRRRLRSAFAVACVLGVLAETLPAAPNLLAFFNRAAGGPGGGERVLNDSNADWGQGLIALRGELARRGIRRVYLAYHGTTDPAIYGIDYVPYLGGVPGPESDWLVVSSYYFVGLPQVMLTQHGYTSEPLVFDMRPLWNTPAAAHPGGCMWMFRIR